LLKVAEATAAENVAQQEKILFDWVKNDNRRFLHVVYRVGDLEKTIKYAILEFWKSYILHSYFNVNVWNFITLLGCRFYTECLGMKLLRKRDIPEDRYSNAFLGYGPEDSNFTAELTYSEFGFDCHSFSV